ncbi:MAG TPA: peptidase S41, partial [Paludibacteraceae bacterium]|nr:peptidase S41 [Paludibacteraceae bacterium]
TYSYQTNKYFQQLYQVAKIEGLDSIAQSEFEALKTKLTPNVDADIRENKDEIEALLSLEIIKRYYYQKGQIEFSLRTDDDLKEAIQILKSEETYRKILSAI